MSSYGYDDPRMYEQLPEQAKQPEQFESKSLSSQLPAFHNFGLNGPGSIVPDRQPEDNPDNPDNPANSEDSPAIRQSSNANLPPEEAGRVLKMFRMVVIGLAIASVAFLAGWFGNQAYNNSFTVGSDSQKYANLIQQAWNTVDQNYVDRKAVNYKQMSYSAIQAILTVLNDKGHTRFLTPADVAAEQQQLSGSFTGVGLYLNQDPTTKQLIISSPIPGAPAEKAGFKHGDIIIAVNGTSVVGKDIASVSSLIQGPAGTTVLITIQRPSTHQTLTIKVARAIIKVPNVIMHYIAQDHVADIQLVQFSDGVSDQLKAALTQARKMGATKYILDLREDPGGYLSEAVNTASEFIPNGNVLLEQDSSGHRLAVSVNGNTVDTKDTIVVLVNGDTASAAEIVSGALQDNHRAIIMGVKTYGTGTVLQEFPLADGSAILLGTQEWLTPSGKFIRGNGIDPNIVVPLNKNAVILTPNDENTANMTEQQILNSGDNQLNAAIHYLETH
ncbi:MAG TPA: S41 family peptidase [Ktedonobacteraceae bacterium]|nr:S41 family peptidase [Ktedonobacteraceae bacterium]